ncbi:MAG: FKBP-type peptidyl-prolyl cis-trans isomerase [Bacteroidales bacterium]|nr:FKBP-type peptidyl-prolyl cis-trans isomerase [Bacteroidales bacterium]
MKYIKSISAAALAVLMFTACSVSAPKVDPQPSSITKADVDSASYAFGVFMAQMIGTNNLGDLNLNQIVKGYKDYLKNSDNFDNSFVNDRMNSFMGKRMEAVGQENLRKGQEFLAKKAKEEGVITTESGLMYKIISNGNGNFPTSPRDTVTANYKLSSIDGELIESSEGSGPVTFPLENVIPGWVEGIQKIDEGGKIMLYVPSDLAYGENGPTGPNATLVFEVDLIEVMHASDAQ